MPSKHNAYHPHFLRRSWLLFFLAFALMSEGFLATNLMMRQSSETYLAAVVPAEIQALTNAQRQNALEPGLANDTQLDAAAQAKANDMALKGYFSHISPDGKRPWDWIIASGYVYHYAGENLAVRFVDSKDVVNAWMASPTHRSNIIKLDYTDTGVGVANGTYKGVPATFVVQFFASPALPIESAASLALPKASQSVTQKIMQIIRSVQAEPVSVTDDILLLIFAVLLISIIVTVFMHVHIQPSHALGAGSTVLGIVLVLLLANTRLLDGKQSAAAIAADDQLVSPVMIGSATTTQAVFSPGE